VAIAASAWSSARCRFRGSRAWRRSCSRPSWPRPPPAREAGRGAERAARRGSVRVLHVRPGLHVRRSARRGCGCRGGAGAHPCDPGARAERGRRGRGVPQERYAAAESLYALRAGRQGPAAVRVNRATSRALAGRGASAESLLAALKDAPGPAGPMASYNVGTLEARDGRLDDALKSLRHSLEADPADADARYNYELALRRQPNGSVRAPRLRAHRRRNPSRRERTRIPGRAHRLRSRRRTPRRLRSPIPGARRRPVPRGWTGARPSSCSAA
jgi:hypothetical protein